VSDVSRVTRGLAIRRAKKRVNLTNDKRKMCSQRFDSCKYRRLQFLRAVSHAVGSEKMLSERHLNGWLSMGLTPTFSTHAVCSRIFHSCIFHPCNYARAAFSTPAFSVAPCSLAVHHCSLELYVNRSYQIDIHAQASGGARTCPSASWLVVPMHVFIATQLNSTQLNSTELNSTA